MRYAFKPERSELKTTIKEMNVPVAFGISKAIKEKGFKQTYVAESAGYTPQELSDMLNGRRLIKACDIPRIHFRILIQRFIGGNLIKSQTILP